MFVFKMFILGFTAIVKAMMHIIKYFFIGLLNIVTIIPRGIFFIMKKILGKENNNSIFGGNRKLSFAVLLLTFCVYLGCVFLISRGYVQNLKIKYLSQDIINSTEIIEKEEEETNSNDTDDSEPTVDENNIPQEYYPNDYLDYLSIPFMEVNFDDLINKNDDTVGWIKVEGTNVNYPVVQADNNNYYLSHDFRKRNNAAGWIFADYRINFSSFGKNTIIYGHNMNSGIMFGSIPSMLQSGYLNNSDKYSIKISTAESNSIWKVFSVYTTQPDTYYIRVNFKSISFADFLNEIKGRSIYDFGIDVTDKDKILTLSTCDNTGTKRVVVHAKMINIEYK